MKKVYLDHEKRNFSLKNIAEVEDVLCEVCVVTLGEAVQMTESLSEVPIQLLI